jgi:hypothetical protein
VQRLPLVLLVLLVFACNKGVPRTDPAPAQVPVQRAELVATPMDDTVATALPRPQALSDTPPPALVEAPPEPSISLVSPAAEAVVENPITFAYQTQGPVARVGLYVDEIPIHDRPLPPGEGAVETTLRGVNVVRAIRAEAFNEAGNVVATDELTFVPSLGFIPLPGGFNRFVVEAINDVHRYPRDGTTPYCWRQCPGSMGMIRSVYYMEQELWPGEGNCFCTGHTLEIFLDALHRWYAANGVDPSTAFGDLLPDDLRGGDFYQQWQGYGISPEASAAAAFELAGIGYALSEAHWEEALTGDFVNLSRDNATGHAVIFHSWLRENGRIVGLRYYGCNGKGDSHPDELSQANRRVSGPSFVSARFVQFGGRLLPEYLFVGHVVDPMLGY